MAAGKGRLVIGAWPHEGARPQVVDKGRIQDWEVRWDETGSVVAMWIAGARPKDPARSGCTRSTKRPVPSTWTSRCSTRPRRWPGSRSVAAASPGTAPAAGGDLTVEVLAWSGDSIGRIQLPTESGVTVVR